MTNCGLSFSAWFIILGFCRAATFLFGCFLALFLRIFLLTDVEILFKEFFYLSFVVRNLLLNLGHTVIPEVTLINKLRKRNLHLWCILLISLIKRIWLSLLIAWTFLCFAFIRYILLWKSDQLPKWLLRLFLSGFKLPPLWICCFLLIWYGLICTNLVSRDADALNPAIIAWCFRYIAHCNLICVPIQRVICLDRSPLTSDPLIILANGSPVLLLSYCYPLMALNRTTKRNAADFPL